jgi:hypothetical protein
VVLQYGCGRSLMTMMMTNGVDNSSSSSRKVPCAEASTVRCETQGLTHSHSSRSSSSGGGREELGCCGTGVCDRW